jgi:hypothetical protein
MFSWCVSLFLFFFVTSVLGNCPNNLRQVNCFADPCQVSNIDCKLNCVSDYCGGCNANCQCNSDSDCFENEFCQQSYQPTISICVKEGMGILKQDDHLPKKPNPNEKKRPKKITFNPKKNK